VTPFIIVECGSASRNKQLVRQDKGVSLLEEYTIKADLKSKSLKPVKILEGWPSMEIGIGYLKKKFLSPAAWAFLQALDELKDKLP
jgi:DNA-binding transcriptional LysR family regulator